MLQRKCIVLQVMEVQQDDVQQKNYEGMENQKKSDTEGVEGV